jgi:hypothetical protein
MIISQAVSVMITGDLIQETSGNLLTNRSDQPQFRAPVSTSQKSFTESRIDGRPEFWSRDRSKNLQKSIVNQKELITET